MAYVIKNIRDHVVHVDGVPMDPGQQLIVRHMTGPISKALDVGDLHLYDGTETDDIHADVESVEPRVKAARKK